MIVNGRAIASDILAEVRGEVAVRSEAPIVRAITVRPNPATESYLKIKTARATDAGMQLEIVRLPDDASTDTVVAAVVAPGADAVIVQLPLPDGIDAKVVCDALPLAQDADVLSSAAYIAFRDNADGALLPPVVCAVEEILSRERIDLTDKKIVVVGKGKLVGDPARVYLSRFGEVTVVTRESDNLSLLKDADLIVSGAGQAGLITPDMIKEGCVLIDAGTSESGGTLAGDADPGCADVASVFTPVPGGVGPIAVACLFKNVALLLSRQGLAEGA